MPRYSDELIADIFAANNIVDYVSKYVVLKKRGSDYSGLCPIQSEKTPSFHVNADKQLFYCFGCGAGGNLVQFVMRTENLDFTEALKLLADNAGIALPEKTGSYDDVHHKKRARIYEMNIVAARFFRDCLLDADKGAEALRYFSERKISRKTINHFGLGYAPDTYDALLAHLKSYGFTDDEAVDASLAVRRDGKVYDKFRDRVMFPIIDVRGNIIGFGGRIIRDSKNSDFKPPKYLNSGETAAFDKGKNLFAMNFAKRADISRLVLVEGYMDVISVYQAGIKNVVATLGTALTQDQAKFMSRYAKEILICYDMDEAGRKAALRAVDIFSAESVRTKIVKLKGAKDPDEYINRHGIAMFKTALDSAVPSTEFRLSLLRPENDINTTEGKIGFVKDAAKVLATVGDSVEVDAYINNISAETGIAKEAIYAEYKKYVSAKTGKQAASPVRRISRGAGAASLPLQPPTAKTEGELINIIAQDRKVYTAVKDIMKPEDYSTETLRKLAALIYQKQSEGKEPDFAAVMNEFSDDPQVQSEASSVLYVIKKYGNRRDAAEQMVRKILLGKNEAQIAEHKNDIQKLGELIKEQTEIKNMKLIWE